jgi:SET domain-containing protein
MKSKLFQNKISVKKSLIHGYGVFAEKAIKKGQIVEECHAVITRVEDDILGDYFFNIRGRNAVLTGFGWIYNHSEEPNVDYEFNFKHRIMVFKAERDIKKGEELYVSYGDDWFESRDLLPKGTAAKEKPKKKKRRKRKLVKPVARRAQRRKKKVSRKK